MSSKEIKGGYCHTFKQMYPGWNNMFVNNLFEIIQDKEVENELTRLEEIDLQVDNMTNYPDAEAVIKKSKDTK